MKSQKVQTSNVHYSFKCTFRIQNHTLHNPEFQACRTYYHGRTHTERTPTHGCCLVGQHQAEIGWTLVGIQVKSGSIKQGSSALMPPYNIKLWLKYGHTITLIISSPLLGMKSVTNTILYLPQVHWGYYQTPIWSPLAMA